MKRFALVLAASLAACFSPDDILIVDGTVASPEPAGQRVRLLRGKPDERNLLCGGFAPFKEAVTDADGGYSFEVFRAQAQGLTEGVGDRCFRAEVEFASGARSSTTVQRLIGPVSLPPLLDWRPGLQLDAGLVTFAPVAPLTDGSSPEGDQVTHRLEARTADGGLAWRQDDRVLLVTGAEAPRPSRVPLTFDDAALVEDEALTLRLRARVVFVQSGEVLFGGALGFAAPVEVEAAEAVLVAGRSAPPTRGLPCPGYGSPCALTDGALEPREPVGPSAALSLDFPTPLVPRWLVVRGLETESPLLGVQLTGVDGGAVLQSQYLAPESLWDPVDAPRDVPLPDGGVLRWGEARLRFLAIPLDAGVPVAGVRVSEPVGLRRAAELSVLE
jgi:hypothetical protein